MMRPTDHYQSLHYLPESEEDGNRIMADIYKERKGSEAAEVARFRKSIEELIDNATPEAVKGAMQVRSDRGGNLLHFAALYLTLSKLKTLISKMSEVDFEAAFSAVDDVGSLPLHSAASANGNFIFNFSYLISKVSEAKAIAALTSKAKVSLTVFRNPSRKPDCLCTPLHLLYKDANNIRPSVSILLSVLSLPSIKSNPALLENILLESVGTLEYGDVVTDLSLLELILFQHPQLLNERAMRDLLSTIGIEKIKEKRFANIKGILVIIFSRVSRYGNYDYNSALNFLFWIGARKGLEGSHLRMNYVDHDVVAYDKLSLANSLNELSGKDLDAGQALLDVFIEKSPISILKDHLSVLKGPLNSHYKDVRAHLKKPDIFIVELEHYMEELLGKISQEKNSAALQVISRKMAAVQAMHAVMAGQKVDGSHREAIYSDPEIKKLYEDMSENVSGKTQAALKKLAAETHAPVEVCKAKIYKLRDELLAEKNKSEARPEGLKGKLSGLFEKSDAAQAKRDAVAINLDAIQEVIDVMENAKPEADTSKFQKVSNKQLYALCKELISLDSTINLSLKDFEALFSEKDVPDPASADSGPGRSVN